MKFENCKLELKLKAQSPMIHFQHSQSGATIRASEVKPKLDRFIIEKWKKELKVDDVRKLKTSEYSDCFQTKENGNDALQYKMQIYLEEASKVDDIKKYKIFYGNMKSDEKKDTEDKECLLFNPTISILCFNSKLQAAIEKYLVEFFLVTNFGTMQGKGFGSFAPASFSNTEKKLDITQEKTIADYLKSAYSATACYVMRFETNDSHEVMFDQIKTFYSVMKSGQNFKGYARSYIFEYAHKYMNLGNEKAWLKQEGIAPIAYKAENERKYKNLETAEKKEEKRYIRALLGTGKVIMFKVDSSPKSEKEPIIIKNSAIERVASPIFFKIVNNVVFIIAKEVPVEVFDKEFDFQNTSKKGKRSNKKGVIKTPEKGSFDIQDFLKKYVEYYNSNDEDGLRRKIYNVQKNKKVVEIR